MNKTIDVLGIGNAIVDILAHADDAFLVKHAMEKGGMMLIDSTQAETIYGDMALAVETSGGSAANTIAGIASLGGKAEFIGKIADDQLGDIFAHDIKAMGVDYSTARQSGGEPTARSFIFVTPDAERTMNTYLGACQNLTPEDVSEEQVARAKVIYLEGYLWDPAEAKKAFLKAMEAAKKHDTQVALTLSDSFCVGRYRDEFLELVENHVDILFANEDEITSLYQVADFDSAVAQLSQHVNVAALTRSAKGCVILKGGTTTTCPAEATDVVDTTGAGDLFAAGFLYGYTQGKDMATCGKLGALCAAEIISHIGARPEVNLASWVDEKA